MTLWTRNYPIDRLFPASTVIKTEPLLEKKAILFTGMQPDGSHVLNEQIFISSKGELMDACESSYIWFDKGFIYYSDKTKLVDNSPPKIVFSLSTTPLMELVKTL